MNAHQQRDLTFSRSVKVDQITVDIIAFIEHPVATAKILAATSNQVIEIDYKGDCTVVIGVQLQGCSYQTNINYFTSISHILHVDFNKVRDSSQALGIEFAALVADQEDHCVRIVDLKDTSTLYDVIGQCGTAGRMTKHVAYSDFGQLKLTRPTYISVIYSSDVIRVIITCMENGKTYPVILNIYPSTILVYDYHSSESSGYITDIPDTFCYPTVRSLGITKHGNQYDECHLEIQYDSSTVAIDYECDSEYNFFIPRMLRGWPVVVNKGTLSYVVYQNSGSVVIRNVVVNNMPDNSISELDEFSLSSDNQTVILFSQSRKTFYYTKISVKHSFHIRPGQLCNNHHLRTYSTTSAESCAYLCIKYGEECKSFTFSSSNQQCSLHDYNDLLNSPVGDCYVLQ